MIQPRSVSEAAHRRALLVVFLLTVGIYLSTLTKNYYWDGVTFALQIEKVASGKRDATLLFHQNHLLYTVLCHWIYRAMGLLGVQVRALTLMQIANAVCGGAGVAVLCRIASRVFQNLTAGIISAATLGLSAVWWKLSTDADAYILAALLILLCLDHLLGFNPRWFIAAVLLAGAMLVHELAALFFPAALIAVRQSSIIKRKRRFAFGMTLSSWAVTLLAYLLSAWRLDGIGNPIGVARWALSNQGGFKVNWNPLPGLFLMPKGTFDLLFEHDFGLFWRHHLGIEIVFAIVALSAVFVFTGAALRQIGKEPISSARRAFRSLCKMNRSLWPVLVAWSGAYIFFLLLWEPGQTYYRAFYAPVLALAFGWLITALQRGEGSHPKRLAVLAPVTLGFCNIALFIVPNMYQDANPIVRAARGAKWDERTIVYYAEHNEADTAFEYFNQSSEWRKMARSSGVKIESELNRVRDDGGHVWLNRGAVEMVGAVWLARHASGNEIRVDVPHVSAVYVEVGPETVAGRNLRSPSDTAGLARKSRGLKS